MNRGTKKKERIPGRQGFVLVTTLILLVVVAMMLGAALALLPGSRMMSGTISPTEDAIAAAQAGVEYARTRLQENPTWRAEGNSVVVDMPGEIWVRESHGNVIGLVWSSRPEPLMFRIRFNYQNGGGAPNEGMSDPPEEMEIESVYVSHNNLADSSAKPLLRASPSNFSVNGSILAPNDVPKYTAVIYSEGFAGEGLSGVSPTQLQLQKAVGRGVTATTIEAYLGRDVSRYGDAVLYGARDVTLQVAKDVKIESRDNSTPPRARTMGDILVTIAGNGGSLSMEDGEAYVKPSTGRFTINGTDSSEPEATRADSRGHFLQLGWEEIDKATASDARLPAGTYVWRTGPLRLDYYAQDFDPAIGVPSTPPDATYRNNSELPSSVDGALVLDPTKLKVKITKNVLVESNGSANGIAFTAESGLLETLKLRPEAELQAPDPDAGTPIITTQGNFRVDGRIRGNGSVTAAGNITFQGESVLEADKDSKVAIYSKRDINIDPVPTPVADSIASLTPGGGGGGPGPSGTPGAASINSFFRGQLPPFGTPRPGDVAFAGVVYAQGNFNVNIGSTANFHLHGMLVAYGGDSSAGEMPGERAGAGYVKIKSENVQLFYDSSFVANLMDQNAASKLDVVSWRRF